MQSTGRQRINSFSDDFVSTKRTDTHLRSRDEWDYSHWSAVRPGKISKPNITYLKRQTCKFPSC